MNIVTGERAASGFASHGVDLALTDQQRSLIREAGAEAILYGLRPEALTLSSSGLSGTIGLLEPTGPETFALVETPLGKLMARVPGKVHQQIGEQVFLSWSPADAHLFDAKSERRIN
jgi:multiple sugar transport system ATP-binding protein